MSSRLDKRNFFSIFIVSGFLLLLFCAPITAAASNEAKNRNPTVFRGISHVHTEFSHDSKASLEDVLEDMEKERLDFAIVTDHNSLEGINRYEVSKKKPKPLLIFANEISGPDGHLIALGVSEEPQENLSSSELIDWIHKENGYAILAHPLSPKEPWANWDLKNWDGFEVYNFAHELYNQDIIGFGLDMYLGDENTVLKTVQRLSRESTKMWDDFLRERHIVAMSGSNAHLKRDRKYFRAALKSSIIYALADILNEASITKTIGEGRSYMVFETLGRADEFSYSARNEKLFYQIGDTVPDLSEIVLHVEVPEPARILLIHNGEVVKEEKSSHLSYPPSDPGAYRVEVYKEDHLWIFTNPIYLEKAKV